MISWTLFYRLRKRYHRWVNKQASWTTYPPSTSFSWLCHVFPKNAFLFCILIPAHSKHLQNVFQLFQILLFFIEGDLTFERHVSFIDFSFLSNVVISKVVTSSWVFLCSNVHAWLVLLFMLPLSFSLNSLHLCRHRDYQGLLPYVTSWAPRMRNELSESFTQALPTIGTFQLHFATFFWARAPKELPHSRNLVKWYYST